MSADAPASKPQLELNNQSYDVPLRPAWVMGIINVTPDSFSDGGECLDARQAVNRAQQFIQEGARIIDIGAESTRPGSIGVDSEEQVRRAIPVIRQLRAQDCNIYISIDTTHADVARAALDAGADIVNDTSALRDDPEMATVVAQAQCGVILMHRRGTPENMQAGGGPAYADVLSEISSFLSERMTFAVQNGVDPAGIILDPGIGFGKRIQDNLKILSGLTHFRGLGRPILIGASRKRFIGEILSLDTPKDRDRGSLACALIAAQLGASIIRVHDVRSTVETLCVADAVGNGGNAGQPA